VLLRIIQFIQIEFIYNAVNLLFTWTALANFYLAFFFVKFQTLFLFFLIAE